MLLCNGYVSVNYHQHRRSVHTTFLHLIKKSPQVFLLKLASYTFIWIMCSCCCHLHRCFYNVDISLDFLTVLVFMLRSLICLFFHHCMQILQSLDILKLPFSTAYSVLTYCGLDFFLHVPRSVGPINRPFIHFRLATQLGKLCINQAGYAMWAEYYICHIDSFCKGIDFFGFPILVINDTEKHLMWWHSDNIAFVTRPMK